MAKRHNKNPPPGMSRRKFLKLAAAAGVLTGCRASAKTAIPTNPPTPQPTSTTAPTATATTTTPPSPTAPPTVTVTATPNPTATATATAAATATATETPIPAPIPESEMANLAFVKTRDRAEGVRRALQLLGINPVQGKQVLLKPNFNSSDPAPGSTHPDTLRTLVEELWSLGASHITVGDRSGQGFSRTVMRDLGVLEMAEELGFDTMPFELLQDEKDWIRIRPPESHWKKGFLFPRACYEAEALVQTCCLKTHQFGGHFTMSLKNSVGMVSNSDFDSGHVYMDELHSSVHQRLMIAEINYAYTPALVVMDGVEAFTSGGPAIGTRKWGEVVVASTDRVAIDVVGVALLRHLGGCPVVITRGSIFQQEQIARAVELGLGADVPQKIRLVTDDPDSESYAAQIQELLLQG